LENSLHLLKTNAIIKDITSLRLLDMILFLLIFIIVLTNASERQYWDDYQIRQVLAGVGYQQSLIVTLIMDYVGLLPTPNSWDVGPGVVKMMSLAEDGCYLATYTLNTVHVWSVRTGWELYTFDHDDHKDIDTLLFSTDATFIVLKFMNGEILIWYFHPNNPREAIIPLPYHLWTLTPPCLSADNTILVMVGQPDALLQDVIIQVWDISLRTVTHRIDAPAAKWPHRVNEVDISADHTLIYVVSQLVGTHARNILVYSVPMETLIHSVRIPMDHIPELDHVPHQLHDCMHRALYQEIDGSKKICKACRCPRVGNGIHYLTINGSWAVLADGIDSVRVVDLERVRANEVKRIPVIRKFMSIFMKVHLTFTCFVLLLLFIFYFFIY